MLARFVSLAALAVVAANPTGKSLINEQSNIDSLNAENGTTWKAGNNARFEGKRKIARIVCTTAQIPAPPDRCPPTIVAIDQRPQYTHTLSVLLPLTSHPCPPPATRAPFPARQA